MNKLVAMLALTATSILLAACGGGGGSSGGGATATTVGSTTTTTLASVTVTCPNGASITATTTDLANQACPSPTLLSITPTNGATGISVDPFAGVVVATSSKLDASSLTTANIKMTIGTSTNVVGTVTPSADGKGFTFLPSEKPFYAQAYNFTANVMDTLGKRLSIADSFTTASIACTAPQVPDSTGTSCVTPAPAAWWPPATTAAIGTKVTGMNQLSPASLMIGDAAWQQAVKDGVVKFLDTGITLTGYSTRPVVWAFYQSMHNLSCTRLIYKDDGSGVGFSDTEGSCNTGALVDWAVGTQSGVIRHFPDINKCGQLTWNPTNRGLDDPIVTCPF